MGTGLLAIGVVVATIAAVLYVTLNRRVIYGVPSADRPAPASGQRPAARRAARPAPAHRLKRRPAGETPAKSVEAVSSTVSGFVMPDNDAEMVAIRAIAKLIQADHITETVALSTVFGVKPGSSKRYKEVQAKLKTAQAEIEEST